MLIESKIVLKKLGTLAIYTFVHEIQSVLGLSIDNIV